IYQVTAPARQGCRWCFTTLQRIARNPKLLELGERLTAQTRGDPGATQVPPGAAWDWEILSIEKTVTSKPSPGSVHVAILARLRSYSMNAGVAGDGREVLVEDWLGRRFRPLYKLLQAERQRRNVPEPYDQVLPNELFKTVWVYELPASAKALLLLPPFDNAELPFLRPI